MALYSENPWFSICFGSCTEFRGSNFVELHRLVSTPFLYSGLGHLGVQFTHDRCGESAMLLGVTHWICLHSASVFQGWECRNGYIWPLSSEAFCLPRGKRRGRHRVDCALGTQRRKDQSLWHAKMSQKLAKYSLMPTATCPPFLSEPADRDRPHHWPQGM